MATKSNANATRKMKWNFDQEQLLIDSVRSQRHLWDIKNSLFSNRYLKRSTYERIAETLIEKFPENEELFTVGKYKFI